MEGLTETSLSRANSLLIKLQEDESSIIAREDGLTHKYPTVSAWKTRETGIKSKISDCFHPFQSLEQQIQFHKTS